MRKIKFIIISLLLFTSFYSCSKEDQIITSQNNFNMPLISLSDSTVQKGEKIFAYGKNLSNYKLRYVTLNDVNVLLKTISDSVYSLFIPFNAGNGKFSFYFYTPSHQDTIIESPNVSIKGDCTEKICLSWNEGEVLDEPDSWVTDEDTIKWNISIQSDTVIIQREYSCGDECYTKNTIVFKTNVTNQLPEYLYAIHWYRDWIDPVIADTIQSAVIEIDKWNSSSVYSGTITFDDDLWVFWVKE